MTSPSADTNRDNLRNFDLNTNRFHLRPLQAADATDQYLSWFRSTVTSYILTANKMQSREDLQAYILAREAREDVLFLGIFELGSQRHIGNVKFEPVDFDRGIAVMGILIGEAEFRGREVAKEVLMACGKWLKSQCGIKSMVLGVDENNLAAVRAYEKIGFRPGVTPLVRGCEGSLVMVWAL